MGIKHSIAIELEDQKLRALVATGSGRDTMVVERHELATNETTLADALATICAGKRPEQTAVYWALGDRRIVSGTVTRSERPSRAELDTLLEEEARRVGLYSESEELVIGYTERRGDDWCADFECSPRTVVEEARAALRAARIDNAWLMSIEGVLSRGLARSPSPTVILDIRQDRARVLLASGGFPRAARKFKLPSTLSGESEEVVQLLLPLVGEVHRSLDLFAGQDLPAPERILPAGELAGMSEVIDQLSEMLELRVECTAAGALHLVTDQESPHAWLVPALMLHEPRHKTAPCLLEPEPLSVVERGTLLGLQLTGIAALAIGLWLGQKAREDGPIVERELRQVSAAIAELERRHAELSDSRETPEIVTQRAQILRTLDSKRVSLSNLLAVLARSRPEEAMLTRVRVDPQGELEVAGIIRARQPDQAMAALGELSTCLGDYPGLRGEGIHLQKASASVTGLPFRYRAQIVGQRSR